MIILHQSMEKQFQKDNGKKISSPSSFFKSKWLEEQDQKKTFDHLNNPELNDGIKDRLNFKSSKASDFERFTQMMDIKRYNDYNCLLYTSPSPRDRTRSRMPSSA